MTGNQYCHEVENGQKCGCEQFTEPIDPNARYFCRECLHGFSKHKPQELPGEELGPLAAKAKVEDNDAVSRKLLEVFHQRKASSRGIDLLSLDLHQAREEVIKGFKSGGTSGRRALATKTKVLFRCLPMCILMYRYYRNRPASSGSHRGLHLPAKT